MSGTKDGIANSMTRPYNKLSVLKLRKLSKVPGRHFDGRGLHLYVQKNGNASWMFRFRNRVTQKPRDKGLGSFLEVSLEDARTKAAECRALLANHADPIDSGKEALKRQRDVLAKRITFGECFKQYYESVSEEFRNKKHTAQWPATVNKYCAAWMDLPVSDIDTEAVLSVLRPIWLKKSETARRVRQRIEGTINWAKAHKRYDGDNPAFLKGHLLHLLPAQTAVVKHRPAVHYEDMPDFMARLSQVETLAAKALTVQILTATRPGEAVKAEWKEFDLGEKMWTIPADRTKALREHSVPLSQPLIDLLAVMPRHPGGLLFPGKGASAITTAAVLKLVKQLVPETPDITSHGFRSTFRDWASAVSLHMREVSEAALAHVISDKTEAAYLRDKLFSKRVPLMQDWAMYCYLPNEGNVTQLRKRVR